MPIARLQSHSSKFKIFVEHPSLLLLSLIAIIMGLHPSRKAHPSCLFGIPRVIVLLLQSSSSTSSNSNSNSNSNSYEEEIPRYLIDVLSISRLAVSVSINRRNDLSRSKNLCKIHDIQTLFGDNI